MWNNWIEIHDRNYVFVSRMEIEFKSVHVHILTEENGDRMRRRIVLVSIFVSVIIISCMFMIVNDKERPKPRLSVWIYTEDNYISAWDLNNVMNWEDYYVTVEEDNGTTIRMNNEMVGSSKAMYSNENWDPVRDVPYTVKIINKKYNTVIWEQTMITINMDVFLAELPADAIEGLNAR